MHTYTDILNDFYNTYIDKFVNLKFNVKIFKYTKTNNLNTFNVKDDNKTRQFNQLSTLCWQITVRHIKFYSNIQNITICYC